MKKTATLLALAGLSMAAKTENLHGSLRYVKVVDHTPENDPYVISNPTNQPKETVRPDDELLLIYKSQYDIDSGIIIRPPRDDIDRGIFVKPRPARQVLYADDELRLFPIGASNFFRSRNEGNVIIVDHDDADNELRWFDTRGFDSSPNRGGVRVNRVDDELALFNPQKVDHHQSTSRRPSSRQQPQRRVDSQMKVAHKEADKGANSDTIEKPKDVGGMIIKEKGVVVHADDELRLFETKLLDEIGFRRGGRIINEHADDELTWFFTKPVHHHEKVRKGALDDADNELRLFDIPPIDDSTSRRPNIPTNFPEVKPLLAAESDADHELCAHKDKETTKGTNSKPEVGGMIARARGVNIQHGHRADDADDELIMFADGGINLQPRKNRIFDPKTLTKPWFDQQQVMYADDELRWFPTGPFSGSRYVERGAHLLISRNDKADDELRLFGIAPVDSTSRRPHQRGNNPEFKPLYVFADDELRWFQTEPQNSAQLRGHFKDAKNDDADNDLAFISNPRLFEPSESRGSRRPVNKQNFDTDEDDKNTLAILRELLKHK